jgi:taurine dioxygenase
VSTAPLPIGDRLRITPLTGSLGARVEGVDLRRDLAPGTADEIARALAEHAVLLFRDDREVGADEQNRLAAVFGEPQPLEIFQFLGALQPSIAFNPGSRIAASNDASAPRQSARIARKDLQNLGLGGDGDGWHADSSFTPWLPKAAVLRAEVIAASGGDTCFASLRAAYEALSPTMQGWLADAKAVHVVPDGFKDGINIWQYGDDAEARFDAAYPPREWPLVVRHPETGHKALFFVPGYIVHIVGLKRAESHALIRFLTHHIASASFVYRHHWQPGDLVVWDEVMCLHRAPDDVGDQDRKVVRVTAGRQVPTAA